MGKQKRLEHDRMQTECFQVIAGLATDIIFEYDIKQDQILVMEKDHDLFKEPVTFDNFTFWAMDYIHAQDIFAFHNFAFDMKSGLDEIRAEFRWKVNDGQYKWFSIQGKTIFKKDGIAKYVVGKVCKQPFFEEYPFDVQKKQQDELTRLYHKAYFKNSLDLYFDIVNNGWHIYLKDICTYATLSKVS